VSNEELQSTNEELQATNEELQATNEELSTVNHELGNRNLELTRLSDDLSNVLTSAYLSMILVGPDGRIRRMTQATERALSLTASDIGRPIGQLRLGVEFPDLEAMVREAIETPAPVEREVQAGDGRSYSVRVRPYRAAGDRIEGAVVSFIDIDDLKRTEREVREARDVARATFETVRDPLVTLDASLHVVQANRSFYETFRLTPAATEGTFIYDLGNRQWDIPELRRLLEEIPPRDAVVSDFEVEYAFEGLGRRTMCLNASLVLRATAEDPLILLAIEDVTAAKELERTHIEATVAILPRADASEQAQVQIQRQSDEVKRALDQARDARGAYQLLNDRIQKVGDQLDAARPDMLKAELVEIRRLVIGHIESEHSPTTARSPKAKPRSAKSRTR